MCTGAHRLTLAILVAAASASVPAAAEVSEEPLVTPVQGTEAHISIAVSADGGAIAEPVTLAPDVFYGLTSRIALGLTHSARAQTGFVSRSAGLCVTSGCGERYASPGLAARVRLLEGPTQVAADAGVIVPRFSGPLSASVKFGFLVNQRWGRVSAFASPNLWFAIAGRDDDEAPNEDRFHIPVGVRTKLASVLEVGLESGVRSPLRELGDLEVPVAATLSVDSTRTIRVGLAAAFEDVRDGTDARTVTIFASSAL